MSINKNQIDFFNSLSIAEKNLYKKYNDRNNSKISKYAKLLETSTHGEAQNLLIEWKNAINLTIKTFAAFFNHD